MVPTNTKSSGALLFAHYARWSELSIAPADVDSFTTLGTDNVRESRSEESGLVAFYWAGDKKHPGQIRVLEVYTDENAYHTHLASEHYRKFRDAGGPLLKRHLLLEAIPLALGAKAGFPPAAAVVRMAEIEVAPAQLESYRAIVTEEIEASVRLEPGVLAIYAVALKGCPNQLRFFEIYADEQAYLQHRDTPHFQKYATTTRDMIVSKKLIGAATGVFGG